MNVSFRGAPRNSAFENDSASAGRQHADTAALGVDRGVVEHREQAEEDRHLQQQRQARRERVGARLLVELHGLARHRLARELVLLALVLVLDLLQLRRDLEHAALALDLPDEDRDQRGAHHDDEADDREHPGDAGIRVESDERPHRVERDEDQLDDPFDGPEDDADDVHGAGSVLSGHCGVGGGEHRVGPRRDGCDVQVIGCLVRGVIVRVGVTVVMGTRASAAAGTSVVATAAAGNDPAERGDAVATVRRGADVVDAAGRPGVAAEDAPGREQRADERVRVAAPSRARRPSTTGSTGRRRRRAGRSRHDSRGSAAPRGCGG